MMSEHIERIRSVHLQNERTIWIRPPRAPASARHLIIFLDAEFYRDGMGTNAMLDELQGGIADS